MEQTELLEILKTMSSLLQNFTEIIARGVGAESGPRPLQRPPLWEGPGAQWPGGPSGQAPWWLCPGMSPPGPRVQALGPASSCQHRPAGEAGRGHWSSRGLFLGGLLSGGLAAARAPHPPLGVEVVVEVPYAESLHLQPCLQDPAGSEGWSGLPCSLEGLWG